jgi:predicted RNase H-like HicB family nuclease
VEYVAVVHKDAESDFGVSFPDFPGCITAGRTLEEAKQMAFEALTGHIRAIPDTGCTMPDASTLDEVMRDPHFRDGVAFWSELDS